MATEGKLTFIKSSDSGFSLNGYGYIIVFDSQNGVTSFWRYDPSLNQWKQLQENYPGAGAYEIKTVSFNGIVYVGLGHDSGDSYATDFWSFK